MPSRSDSDGTVRAPHGLVCSVDARASAAGVAVLDRGGTAVDAAIATNAVLTVTAQHLCGLGGDLFAVVHGPAGLITRAADAAQTPRFEIEFLDGRTPARPETPPAKPARKPKPEKDQQSLF